MKGAYLFELDPGSPATPQVRAQIDRQLHAEWPPDLRRLCKQFLAEWRFAEALLIAESLDLSEWRAPHSDRTATRPSQRAAEPSAPLRRRRPNQA